MKKLLLILIIGASLSGNLQAQSKSNDWKIERHGDEANLVLASDEEVKIELTVNSGVQKILEVKKMGQKLLAVIYSTGMAGTHVPVEVIQAAVFNPETRQFLGDYPYQYKSNSAPYKLDQPIWKLDEKSLKIMDENTDLNISINL